MQRNRISKGLFFWGYGASVVVYSTISYLLLCVIPLGIGVPDAPELAATNMLLIFVVLSHVSQLAVIFSFVVFLIFIYRIWKAIQDGHASTSPSRAVGFLFIPIFHIYWTFRVFWGFAKDYNRFIDRHGLDLRRLPERLYLAYPILTLVTFLMIIPTVIYWTPPAVFFFGESPFTWFLSQIAPLATAVIGLVVIWKTCNTVNALPESLIQMNLRKLEIDDPDYRGEAAYRGARRISKLLHIALFLAGFLIAPTMLYFSVIAAIEGNLMLMPLLVPLSLAGLACSFHALVSIIHRSWEAVQDGHAYTSPRAAVNFLFIPLFNVYWAFRAIGGFAGDYNRLLTRHRLDAPPLSRPLYMIFSSFAVTFPLASVLLFFESTRAIPIIWIIAGIMYIWKSCDAINALPRPAREKDSMQGSMNHVEPETAP